MSVLFALGDADTRREVLAAHDAAVAALAGWIERHAHTRYRIGGEVAVVDAEGIVAAAFRQHTSRALDPQLHTHLVIANRVKSPDGRWLALDARLIKHDQQSLSAIYHAGLRSELTDRLGVAWEPPEHGIAEIRDVPDDVLAEFSTRTGEMRRRIDDKLDRFIDTMGRDPTPGSDGSSNEKQRSTAARRKSTRVDAASCTRVGPSRPQALGLDPPSWSTAAIEQVAPRLGLDGHASRLVIDEALADDGREAVDVAAHRAPPRARRRDPTTSPSSRRAGRVDGRLVDDTVGDYVASISPGRSHPVRCCAATVDRSPSRSSTGR